MVIWFSLFQVQTLVLCAFAIGQTLQCMILSFSGLDFNTVLSFSSLDFMVMWFSIFQVQTSLLYDLVKGQTLLCMILLFSGLDFRTVLPFSGLDFNTVVSFSGRDFTVVWFFLFLGRGAGSETVHVQILARLPGTAQLRHLPSTTSPPGHGLVQTERQGARHHPLHVSAACQTKIS